MLPLILVQRERPGSVQRYACWTRGAGAPLLAEENSEDFMEVPAYLSGGGGVSPAGGGTVLWSTLGILDGDVVV